MEVEFEWIRQFYIQGSKHFEMHVWWHQPMQEMISFLLQIEQRLVKIFKALILSKGKGCILVTGL